MKDKVIKIGFLIIIMIALVIIKVYYSSFQEYKKAEIALKNNRITEAITHFERSIHFYGPFSKSVKSSIINLWEIGEKAEKAKDIDIALVAFRGLRSSLYAVRSFYTPYKEWIKKCDEKIAMLVANKEDYIARNEGKSFEERKNKVIETLQRNNAPSVGWSIFLEIGFFSWVIGTILFINKGFENNSFNWRKSKLFILIIILGYIMWIIGMIKA